MNKETLVKIKKTLELKREELSQRVASVKQDFAKGRDPDLQEQVTERENEEVLVQIQAEAEQDLATVCAALIKIDQGDYGVCNSCNSLIDEKRLMALPYAVSCIKCA
jgi:RNA polymerase-binding transcription factor DksA